MFLTFPYIDQALAQTCAVFFAGRSRNLTLAPQMVDPSAIPGSITRKECARRPFLFPEHS